MVHRCRAAAALLVCVAVLAACTASAEEAAAPRIIQPGAPGEPNRELTPEELAELEPPVHTEVDVRFMHDMIVHHAQALRMTALVEDRTEREDLPLFAERMDISQTDEIELMQRWLEARDEDPGDPDAHDAMDGHEPRYGMLTEEEFAQLEAASGPEFDRLFLELMIRHHRGALEMVDELYRDDGGAEVEIDQFATHVVGDQNIELSRMEGMLASLDEESRA